jgi:hypothetical protein
MEKKVKTTKKASAKRSSKKEDLPGYPVYPPSEDVYSQLKEETDIDPEFPKQKKSPTETINELNEKDFADDVTGGDLDVPGAELDDQQENIGSEDEENNLYSLGGDKEP